MKGYVYILKCYDNSYYTGSTTNLEFRVAQHIHGEGAIHTKNRLPVTLVYLKYFKILKMLFVKKNKFKDGVEEKRRL